jgi:hypothetical protein
MATQPALGPSTTATPATTTTPVAAPNPAPVPSFVPASNPAPTPSPATTTAPVTAPTTAPVPAHAIAPATALVPPSYLSINLCSTLKIVSTNTTTPRGQPGPANNTQLESTKADEPFLPGRPFTSLTSVQELASLVADELVTVKLDDLSPRLWLMAKPDSSHISSLHHQNVRGRNVVISESPDLHLIWIYERVFLKPIPEYLFSTEFWEYFFISDNSPVTDPIQRESLHKAAKGFLRSYAYLIQHPSDFHIAVKSKLIPIENITFNQFCKFIKQFRECTDDEVSPRYHYGELRLTRLNIWTKVFFRGFRYQKVDAQYGAIFSRYYAPLLFLFGIISVVLSAMQVELGVQQVNGDSGNPWDRFAGVSRWFSVITLLLTVTISLFLMGALVLLILREVIFAVSKQISKWLAKRRERKQNAANNAAAMSGSSTGIAVKA